MKMWTTLAAVGAGGLAAYGLWRYLRPRATILFLSDTHGSAVLNSKLVQAVAAESGSPLVVLGGDVADSPELYGPWWDEPFKPITAKWKVVGVPGNHDDPDEFEVRFGPTPRVESVPGCDLFLAPWNEDGVPEALLAAVSESKATFKILVIHRPFHLGDPRFETWGPALRKMDLILAGHEHVLWEETFDIGGKAVRQIVVPSGPKKYPCDNDMRNCMDHVTAYLRIDVGSQLKVTRRFV